MKLLKHTISGNKFFGWFDMDEGSAFVICVEKEGALIPVEVRFSPLNALAFHIADIDYLVKAWKPPKELMRLTSHSLRQISLSEVVIQMRRLSLRKKFHCRSLKEELGSKNYHNAFKIEPYILGARNSRDCMAMVSRLEVALLYMKFVADGEDRPINAIAEELGLDVERARRLVAGARKEGLLTSENQGSVGGVITEKASELVEKLKKETGKK